MVVDATVTDVHLVGGGVVRVSALVLSGIIGRVVDKEHEVSGIDLMVHAETADDLYAAAGARSAGPSVLGTTARREEKR